MKIISFIFVLFFAVMLKAVKADESWTLEKCIEYALENNTGLKLQKLASERSYLNVEQNKAQHLPDLNSYFSHNLNFGRTVDPFTNEFATDLVQSNNFSIVSNATLYNGGRIRNRIEQAEFEFRAAREDINSRKWMIQLNTTAAFLQILLQMELITVIEEQIALSKQQLEKTLLEVEVGKLTEGMLLEVKARLASEEIDLLNAQNRLQIAYLDLRQLIDLPPDVSFAIYVPEILPPVPETQIPDINQVYDQAVANHPEMKSIEYQKLSYEKSLLVSKSEYMPSLTLRGAAGTGYSGLRQEVTGFETTGFQTIGFTQETESREVISPVIVPVTQDIPFSDQLTDNINMSLGIVLNIPIYNRRQAKTMIGLSEISIQEADYLMVQKKNQLRKDIEQAHLDVILAQRRYLALEQVLEAHEKAFEYIEKRFNNGLANAFEYQEAKNRVTKTASELIQSKFEFEFNKKVLEFYSL